MRRREERKQWEVTRRILEIDSRMTHQVHGNMSVFAFASAVAIVFAEGENLGDLAFVVA